MQLSELQLSSEYQEENHKTRQGLPQEELLKKVTKVEYWLKDMLKGRESKVSMKQESKESSSAGKFPQKHQSGRKTEYINKASTKTNSNKDVQESDVEIDQLTITKTVEDVIVKEETLTRERDTFMSNRSDQENTFGCLQLLQKHLRPPGLCRFQDRGCKRVNC